MLEVGEIPILVHIMRKYYSQGFNDFVICAGYKSWEIKKYFLSYEHLSNHIEIDHRQDLRSSPKTLGKNLAQENWRVRVIDTGLESMTGARVARAFDEVNNIEPLSEFALTYGDGLCDADMDKELSFHRKHGLIGTVLGVKNSARFGELDLAGDKVSGFLEKPESRQGYINGGFFFFKSDFREYLDDEKSCILERKPLASLAEDSQLAVYKHDGFWHPMDTLRDKIYLQKLWDDNKAPWKVDTTVQRS